METLCKIRDLYRAIAEFETRFEKAHHLCLNEGMLLCCLSRKKRLSSGEIAEQLGLSNSNTSKVIRSVEDKGYIERNLGDCDKRQMYFSLTAEGKKILKEMECCNIEIPELLRSVLYKKDTAVDEVCFYFYIIADNALSRFLAKQDGALS